MDMVSMMVGKTLMVFEQVVKVEVCLSEGFSCDIVADGHQTVCRQKFTSHRWSLTKRQNVKKTAIRPFAGRSSTCTLHRWSLIICI